jgi:hypothetical protein
MIFIIFPGFDAPSAWHVYSPAQAWYLTALLDIVDAMSAGFTKRKESKL